MRNLLAVLLLAFACSPTNRVAVPCNLPFLELAAEYDSRLVVTDQLSGDVLYDGDSFVRVRQSGGAGTDWAGALGTAKPDHILVDDQWERFGSSYSLQGTVRGDVATFRYLIDDDFDVLYEFTDIREPDPNALVSSRVYVVDFRSAPSF